LVRCVHSSGRDGTTRSAPSEPAPRDRVKQAATGADNCRLEELRVSDTAATIRWPATFGDAFPRERPADAATCVPAVPKREAAMTVRCTPTAHGGEGHSASKTTPSISMNNKHLTVALSRA
jgi:hypothetical protein